jgi:DNA-binding NarL/FixJ family response regulator
MPSLHGVLNPSHLCDHAKLYWNHAVKTLGGTEVGDRASDMARLKLMFADMTLCAMPLNVLPKSRRFFAVYPICCFSRDGNYSISPMCRKTMHSISILIAIGHSILRAGMRKVLELEKDMTVVGEAQDGLQAVGMAMRLQPSVMVLDCAIQYMRTVEITRSIRENNPETRVIAFSCHRANLILDPDIGSPNGGQCPKHYSEHEISSAIRMAHTGDWSRHNVSAQARRNDHLTPGGMICDRTHGHGFSQLTPREVEVLQLIADGYANKQTAIKLAISKKTVEKHRDNLMKKLGIHNSAGLTRYAIEAGITDMHDQYIL